MEKEKIVFKGSHPDSLYRVSSSSGAGAGKMARVLRVLRWPAVLLVACVALIMFVYFLMPSNLDSDLEVVNGTYWENKAVARFGGHKHNKNSENNKKNTKTTADAGKKGSKTPEIDFYEADPNKDKKYDFISVVEKITEHDQNAKTPIAPVFPEHISPEVQYGNEEADTQKLRHPKLMTENNVPSDSTAKPHITQKPEKPLAIYFDDASNTEIASTESVSRAETINDFTNDEKESTKTTKLYYPPGQKHRPTQLKPFGKVKYNSAEIPPEVQEYYGRREPSSHVPITSSHSKYFGIGIEDAESMKSTTQNSIYNTRVSPTLPTWRDGDDTTTKKYPVNNPDAPQCHSTQLPLCRGVLPYDLAGNPAKIAGVEATQHLAQIEFLVSTNCSERIKQFFCGLLEPECNASPYPPNLPCFNLCQTIKDTCDAFIPRELLPTFNCRQYSNTNCLGARAPCSDRELQCEDGTCVLRDWICDGTRDCLGGEDEKECVSCRSNEFICPTGGCISKVWTCDGYEDCPGGEDEAEQLCNGRHQPTRYEPGEESAGSAPAPAYKKIGRGPILKHRSDLRKHDDHDSSKELLMTSDSSNALKRNFTRRPSPSRLSPYKPKLRLNQATTPLPAKQEENDDNAEQVTWGPSSEEETETKDVAKSKAPPKPTHPQPKTENSNNRESDEDLRMSDMGIFDESEKTNADEVQKLITTATPKSNNKHLPVPPLPRMPPFMVPTPNKPSKMSSSLVPSPVYTPGSMREYNLPSAATKPPSTILDKSVNQYEKIIDGATLLRKAAEAAAAEARASSVNATDKFDDDYPVARQRTSHISPCPSGELRCVDGRCITLAQLCDGTIDCSDHADEDNCFT